MTPEVISFLTVTIEPAEKFAHWMSARRKVLGLTLDQLEARTGIKKQHLSTLERAAPHSLTGKPVVPRRITVEKIARGLGVAVDVALSEAGYLGGNHEDSQRSKIEKLRATFEEFGVAPEMLGGIDALENLSDEQQTELIERLASYLEISSARK